MFQTSRSNLISIAKGICIILMVIGHSGCQRDVFSFIYFFHMPLFFFVSGFFFSIDKVCNLESYIVRKIKALWLPFLKWSLIFLAAHNLFYRIHFVNSAFTIVDYLKQLCLIPFMYGNDELIGGFWFLNNLFYTTIFVAIFCRIAQNRMPNDSKLSLLVFTVSFLLFLLGLSIYDKSGHVAAREFVSLTYAMTCFCLGYVANSKRIFSSSYTHEHINEAPNNTIENMKFLAMGGGKIVLCFLTLSIATLEAPICRPFEHISPIYTPYIILMALVGIIMAFELAKIITRYKTNSRLFVYVGENTMQILIWHFLGLKIISLIIILLNNMPISTLENVRCIRIEEYPFLYLLCSLFAVIFSLSISSVLETMQLKIKGGNSPIIKI